MGKLRTIYTKMQLIYLIVVIILDICLLYILDLYRERVIVVVQ